MVKHLKISRTAAQTPEWVIWGSLPPWLLPASLLPAFTLHNSHIPQASLPFSI